MKRMLACVVLCAFSVRAQTPPEPEPPPPEDASAPLPPDAVPHAADQLPPPGTAWSLRVHLKSNDPRVELRRGGSQGPLLCKTPCDQLVQFQLSDTFVLGGPTLSWSEPFSFRPRNGDVTLKVAASSESIRKGAKVLVFLGGGVALGMTMATYAAGANCVFGEGGEGCSGPSAGIYYGVTLGGIVAAAVGGIILLGNPQTSFTVQQ